VKCTRHAQIKTADWKSISNPLYDSGGVT